MKKFYEYDGNMVLNFTNVATDKEDVKFFDIREEPFEVYGFFDYKNGDIFRRLPDEFAADVSQGVAAAQREAAGGRVRFSTDSQYVAIKASFERVGSNSRTPQLGIAGFDLYIDTEFGSRFYRPLIPPYDVTDGYETYIGFPDRKMRHITINFPYHTVVKKLEVGLQKDSELGNGMKYRNDRPVIFYGSSITHGTAASRPGLIYENILSRRLNMNYTNLGFGGSAAGEKQMAEYMAKLDMCMFVCDYDYNAADEKALVNTHKNLYKTIRDKKPNIPYIIISKPDFAYRPKESEKRRSVIYDTYKYACDSGDENVYYIDGSSIFRGRDWDNCFNDTLHPNDIGFLKMADALEPVIEGAFAKSL